MSDPTQITTKPAIPAEPGEFPLATVRRAAISPVARGKSAGSAGKRPAGPNLLAIVYHGLRGRLRLAAFIGVFAGIACAFIGWKIGHPVYHSEALLRVAYSMPKVFEQTDQNEPMGQMFDTYMQSQKVLIGSRRVIDMSLKDPIWQASGCKVPANPDEYFIENLEVTIQPRSEFILISITDSDPAMAAAAVTAITNGYAQLYHSQEEQREKQRTDALESRRTFLRDRVEKLHTQVREVAKKYGTTALDTLHDAAMLRVARFDTARSDIRMAMVNASPGVTLPQDPPETASTASATTAPSGNAPSLEQIALTDSVMRGYLNDQDGLERELRRLASMGFGPSHRQVVSTTRALEDARSRARWYATAPHMAGGFGARASDDSRNIPLTTVGKSVDMLRQDEIAVRGLLDEAKAELTMIGIDRLALRDLESEKAASQLELEQISKRLAALGGEAALGGRLTTVSAGEVPVLPDRDPRRKIAAAGLVGGFCIPAGVLTLLALIRPSYRYHDEAEAGMETRIPLLGILPAMEPGLSDTEEMTHRAAHSLHQLRVTLRAQSPRNGCCSYLVTSASPGEGKTSLTMALALSFAASHMRTLIIDADLVGRQLTQGFRAQEFEGLHEALAAGSMRGLIRKEPGGVDLLCAGRARSVDACGLSPAAVDILLAEARGAYDVVLVDSGPIMGSVEAAVFAPEVDKVIFAISRGQHADLVRKAQQRLDALGARMAGVVFNRAHLKDFHRSPFGSSSASAAWDVGARPTLLSATPEFIRFGPLVKAVASGMPTDHS